MLPPEERLVGAQLDRYISDKLYWVLHAPRQTGKTTFLQSWMRKINAGDEAIACYVSVERCQGVAETDRAMPDICKAVQEYAEYFGLPIPKVKTFAANSMVSDILLDWAVLVAPKPLVVLFDEVDILEGEALVSFLRQLRGGICGTGTRHIPGIHSACGDAGLEGLYHPCQGRRRSQPRLPL
jgi:Cdc6-like AAA superfamily ATPase